MDSLYLIPEEQETRRATIANYLTLIAITSLIFSWSSLVVFVSLYGRNDHPLVIVISLVASCIFLGFCILSSCGYMIVETVGINLLDA